MEMKHDYQFFFVGGACGSFVKALFHCYHNYDVSEIRVNPVTGDCHNNKYHHCHFIKDLNPDQELILIDFDDDDKKIIIKMAFNKLILPEIAKDPAWMARTSWDLPSTIEPAQLQQTLLNNPDYWIFPEWHEQVTRLTPVLTIKFKDILFGNLNEIIANFFHKPLLDDVDTLIKKFREINKQYLDIL